MSSLETVLHVGETFKATTRKTYQSNCGGVSLKSSYFFAVHSNFTYDSEAYDLMKLYLETSHSECGRTNAVELLCGKPFNLL